MQARLGFVEDEEGSGPTGKESRAQQQEPQRPIGELGGVERPEDAGLAKREPELPVRAVHLDP